VGGKKLCSRCAPTDVAFQITCTACAFQLLHTLSPFPFD
jgi:hypothetical protein